MFEQDYSKFDSVSRAQMEMIDMRTAIVDAHKKIQDLERTTANVNELEELRRLLWSTLIKLQERVTELETKINKPADVRTPLPQTKVKNLLQNVLRNLFNGQ